MNRIIRTLTDQLARKGVEVNHIPAFIRNLLYTIAGNSTIDLSELNSHLHLLGWGDIDLDDYTLQLILTISETGFESFGFIENRKHRFLTLDSC